MENRVGLRSNTSNYQKLLRVIAFGKHNLDISNSKTSKYLYVGKTYYLLRSGEIIIKREWHEKGSPEYIVCGSHEGCVDTKKRLKK